MHSINPTIKHLKIIILSITLLWASQYSYAQISLTTLNDTLVGVTNLYLDINNDNNNDFAFEILELSPNTYAARVVSVGMSQFLDNSTFGYPDALNFNDAISGYFNNGNGVLGTFNNAGQFNGNGIKYLGIKVNDNGNEHIGWVALNCNTQNDTLIILSYAYNTIPNEAITAGQVISSTAIAGTSQQTAKWQLYPNPCSNKIHVKNLPNNATMYYTLYNLNGQVAQQGMVKNSIDISHVSPGTYILQTVGQQSIQYDKLQINR
jgi:hypothetical protein